MANFAYLLLTAALLELVCCGQAWYYQSSSNQPSNSHLLKNQFLLPPYPTYQHDILHQPQPPSFTLHDNRYYGAPGEFAEPTSYNELSFEGPYEVTSPRIPGLYFRLSSGVFVPVKAVYSFPPFLERIIQRIQGYYSVYNPPDTLGLDRPLPDAGVPIQPTLDALPVLPPHPEIKPELGYIPPPPPGPVDVSPETPEPEEPSTTEATTTTSSTTTTTESTKEETTPDGGENNEISSVKESIESTTDAPVETTTTV